MKKLRDFTPDQKKQYQIKNVKSRGDYYVIEYNFLNFEKNTAETFTTTVIKNGGAKISLLLHYDEMGYI